MDTHQLPVNSDAENSCKLLYSCVQVTNIRLTEPDAKNTWISPRTIWCAARQLHYKQHVRTWGGQTSLLPSTNISPDNWNKVIARERGVMWFDAAQSHDQVTESWLVSAQEETHRTNWHHTGPLLSRHSETITVDNWSSQHCHWINTRINTGTSSANYVTGSTQGSKWTQQQLQQLSHPVLDQ